MTYFHIFSILSYLILLIDSHYHYFASDFVIKRHERMDLDQGCMDGLTAGWVCKIPPFVHMIWSVWSFSVILSFILLFISSIDINILFPCNNGDGQATISGQGLALRSVHGTAEMGINNRTLRMMEE